MGESATHRVPYVKCSKVFVGVPHQLAAYTATTDKSVLGKHSSQSSAQCGGIGIGTVCSVVYCCTENRRLFVKARQCTPISASH